MPKEKIDCKTGFVKGDKIGFLVSSDKNKVFGLLDNFLKIKFLRQTFLPTGLDQANRAIFDLDNHRKAVISAKLTEVLNTSERFQRAMVNRFSDKTSSKLKSAKDLALGDRIKLIPDKIIKEIDLLMRNPDLVNNPDNVRLSKKLINDNDLQKFTQKEGFDNSDLGEDLIGAMRDMRGQVKSLSGDLISAGVVDGDLAIKIAEGADTYLTRSYRIHDQGIEWIEKVQDLPAWAMGKKWGREHKRKVVGFWLEQNDYYADKLEAATERFLKTDPESNPKTYGKAKGAVGFWRKKIDEATKRLETEREFLTNPAKIDWFLKKVLSDQVQNLNPGGAVKKGKLGSKDLGILMAKKELPKDLRELLGEYEDPLINYSKSILKQVHLLENAKFLANIEEAGEGKWLFKPGDIKTKKDAENYVLLATESSKTMSPLNGYYVHPDLADFFETYNNPEPLGWGMGLLVQMSAYAKYSKTILSPVTHVRNFMFNNFFHLVNGHMGAEWGESSKIVITQILGHTGFERLGKLGGKLEMSKEDINRFQDMYKKYSELGITNQSVHVNDLRALAKDIDNIDPKAPGAIGVGLFKVLREKVGKHAELLYQLEDDFHKIVAFEAEKRRYGRALFGSLKGKKGKSFDVAFEALPEEDRADFEDQIAIIIRNTYPTYELISKNVQRLRRLPLASTFPSFVYETYRVTKNSFMMGLQEAQSENKAVRKIGYRRLGGVIGTPVILQLASTLSLILLGMGGEDDDVEHIVPPWDEKSLRIQLSRRAHEGSYISVSNVIPQGILINIIKAGMVTDGGAVDKYLAIFQSAMEPFYSEDMHFRRFREAFIGERTTSGKPITHEDYAFGKQLRDKFAHYLGVLTPGAITQAGRIIKSFVDPDVTDYYKLSPGRELLATFAGIRVTPYNWHGSARYKGIDFDKRLRAAKGVYYRMAKKKGASDGQIERAEKDAILLHGRVMKEAMSFYDAAIRQGSDPRVIKEQLENGGLSSKDVRMIASGRYRPPRF